MSGLGRERAKSDIMPKPTIAYSLVIWLREKTIVVEVAKGIRQKEERL